MGHGRVVTEPMGDFGSEVVKMKSWNLIMGAAMVVSAAVLSGCVASHPPSAPISTADSGEKTSMSTQAAWWSPGISETWQVQLSGGLDATVVADIYDVDAVDTPSAALEEVKGRGAKLVCYINGGAWEDWRTDAGLFPQRLLGKEMEGWPGEKWLDVSQPAELLPIMSARMDECVKRGFDAVDVDNVDGYDNDTGFTLTREDQILYIQALAKLAHDKGLGFGLKNTLDLVGDLAADIDFAVNEQCHEYDECSGYDPLLAEGKPVVVIEYTGKTSKICSYVPVGMHILFKDANLGAAVERCG